MNTADRKNQRQRILDLLLAAHGEEVPSLALSRISLQYGARVKELRGLGFRIVNRTERRAGQIHGYFRLEAGMPATRDAACDPPKRSYGAFLRTSRRMRLSEQARSRIYRLSRQEQRLPAADFLHSYLRREEQEGIGLVFIEGLDMWGARWQGRRFSSGLRLHG
jgi:hypothetical protein